MEHDRKACDIMHILLIMLAEIKARIKRNTRKKNSTHAKSVPILWLQGYISSSVK